MGKITLKICWDENSFTKNLVVRRTTRPQFLVVLTYFLVAEDARMLEFCNPVQPFFKICVHSHIHHIQVLYYTMIIIIVMVQWGSASHHYGSGSGVLIR